MFVQAGRYMLQYQNYHKALELFLLGSAADPTGIELAIETVRLIFFFSYSMEAE